MCIIFECLVLACYLLYMWFCFVFLMAGTGLQGKLSLLSVSYWTLKPELLDREMLISSLEATEH